jgi:succinoglycan biosynthesis protein ExoV
MKLYYHTGKNFGDAINPMIFNHYLGEYLNDDTTEVILGIGSILGLFKKPENCKKVYVFSSGYAKGAESTYGKVPQIDKDYEIICLRGEGTAKAINVSAEYGLADGALLLPLVRPLERKKLKTFKFSFMPHSGTLNVYEGWQKLCNSIGVHLIDPRKDPELVLADLMDTEVLIAEAMHGAIIADAYRIPWIPVKTISTINEFKWADYCNSVELPYQPFRTKALYSGQFIQQVFTNKFPKLSFLRGLASVVYGAYQVAVVKPSVKKQFKTILKQKPILTTDKVFKKRQSQLVEKMAILKSRIKTES